MQLFQEFLVVAFSGILPVGLLYLSGGIDDVVAFIQASIPQGYLLAYGLLLAVLFYFVELIDRSLWKRTDAQRLFWLFLTSCLRKISSNLLGLWRVFSGVLLSIPLLWVFTEPNINSYMLVLPYLGYGLAALLECWAISYIFEEKKISLDR